MFGEAGIEQIILIAGYAGIFGLMTLNGVFSFPSSQILYIISGYFAFTGNLTFMLVALVGAVGNTLGNGILFYLSREKGLQYITKLTLLPEIEIKKIQIVFNRRGPLFVFIGKLLPAIKVFIPIVAGIGRMKLSVFLPIIFAASFLWANAFLAIGYYFGKSADVFGRFAIILIIIVFFIVFGFRRYMNSKSVLAELNEKEKTD